MPTVEVDEREINYTDTGTQATPVVFVHAFPLDSRMWGAQIDSLGDRYRCIAVDLLGFGGSAAPEDRSAYSMDAFADSVAAVLDDAGVDKAVVVGLSMGGYASLALWRRHGARVAAFVLADTRAEADPPEGKEKRTNQQADVAANGPGGLIEALPGALLGKTTHEQKPDVVDKAKKLMDNPAAGYVGALEAMKNRPDSTADLASIDVPTLVIVGEEDGVTPPEASRTIHEHVGGSRLVTIPGAGHLSNLEAPEAFNGALAEFLDQL